MKLLHNYRFDNTKGVYLFKNCEDNMFKGKITERQNFLLELRVQEM